MSTFNQPRRGFLSGMAFFAAFTVLSKSTMPSLEWPKFIKTRKMNLSHAQLLRMKELRFYFHSRGI